MKKSIIPLLLTMVVISLGLSACCNCGNPDKITLKGEIVIVGNEPFTQLALKLDNSKIYLLECDDNLRKELWEKQGSRYAIDFIESRVDPIGMPVLKVESAIPINK